jgi:hypothetical protein
MKNTGLKILHRMTAVDDRNMVGATMSATPAQLEHVGAYDKGEALIFYELAALSKAAKVNQPLWRKLLGPL